MVSKALDKSKNTAKVRFFDALSLAFAMSFKVSPTPWRCFFLKLNFRKYPAIHTHYS